MANIDRIVKEVGKGYRLLPSEEGIDPDWVQAGSLGARSRTYIRAAAVLERDGFLHYLPSSQLLGHAVELALKACLAAAGLEPPHGHSLIELYRAAEEKEYNLEDWEFAAVVHLHHIYFQDLSTQTKYKARYPTKQNEHVGGVSPKTEVYEDIVEILLKQVATKGGGRK